MFGDSAADALPPHPETGGFQLTAHDVDDLTLREAGALFYLLKAGAVLPCITDDAGNLFWRAGRFHGVWDSVAGIVWRRLNLKRLCYRSADGFWSPRRKQFLE